MGQKVQPVGIRLGITSGETSWYASGQLCEVYEGRLAGAQRIRERLANAPSVKARSSVWRKI